jgi:hypothetical protein
MAATIPVETESGSYSSGRVHPHNGYYAGDFTTTRSGRPAWGAGSLSGSTPRTAVQA